jgi:hypothetical protein
VHVQADGQEFDLSAKQSAEMKMKRAVLVSIMLLFVLHANSLRVATIQTKIKAKKSGLIKNSFCIPKQELRPQLQFFFK